MSRPIRTIVADLAAVTGREVSSVAAYAADRQPTVCALLVSWSGGAADPMSTWRQGLRATDWRAWPRTLLMLPPMMLDEIHAEAIAAAWADGAWDVAITVRPPSAGHLPHIVWSSPECDLDDVHQVASALRAAARAGGLTEWGWRPLCNGPAIRRRAWLGRDTTLAADGSRQIADLPAVGCEPPPHPHTVIRLGRPSQ